VQHNLMKDARMKRWIARHVSSAALAAYGICASASALAGGHSGFLSQDGGSVSCENWGGCGTTWTWEVPPAKATIARYFTDIPMTVVGSYGDTALNMLSNGPFMLVKWPGGCCPDGSRWHAGTTRRSRTGDGQHVIFLWPAL
jgi:hypothetical protein